MRTLYYKVCLCCCVDRGWLAEEDWIDFYQDKEQTIYHSFIYFILIGSFYLCKYLSQTFINLSNALYKR